MDFQLYDEVIEKLNINCSHIEMFRVGKDSEVKLLEYSVLRYVRDLLYKTVICMTMDVILLNEIVIEILLYL